MFTYSINNQPSSEIELQMTHGDVQDLCYTIELSKIGLAPIEVKAGIPIDISAKVEMGGGNQIFIYGTGEKYEGA